MLYVAEPETVGTVSGFGYVVGSDTGDGLGTGGCIEGGVQLIILEINATANPMIISTLPITDSN